MKISAVVILLLVFKLSYGERTDTQKKIYYSDLFDSIFRNDNTDIFILLSGDHFNEATNKATLDLLNHAISNKKYDIYLEAPNTGVYYYKKFYETNAPNSVNPFLNYTLFYNDSVASSFYSHLRQRNINLYGFDCTHLTEATLIQICHSLEEVYSKNALPISNIDFKNFLKEISQSYGYGHRLVALFPEEKSFLINCFEKLLTSLIELKETLLEENIRDIYSFYKWIFERKVYYDYEIDICSKRLNFYAYRDSLMASNFKNRFDIAYNFNRSSKAIIDVGAFHFFGDAEENNKRTFVERLINYYGRSRIKTFCFIPEKEIKIPNSFKSRIMQIGNYKLLISDLCTDIKDKKFVMTTLCKENELYAWLKKYDYIIIV